jgi:O-antigen ligase/predicted Zn-dependent protease
MDHGKNNLQKKDLMEASWFSVSKNEAISHISKIIAGGIVLILLFPLIGDYGNLLFPIGRDIILRFTVEIIGALFIVLVYLERSYLVRPNITIWLFSLFWLIGGITTITSVQPQFSLWGNIFRGQGFFSQTHIFLLFLIIVGFIKKTKQWEKIIWFSLGVGVAVSVITLVEYIFNQSEAQSTLNNPNFLGMYLLFPIFLTVSLALDKNNFRWRIILFPALVLELVAAYFSNSRGTYLGIIVGLIGVFFVYKLLPIFLRFSKKAKIFLLVFLVAGLAISTSFFRKEIVAVDSFIKNPKAEQINSRLIDWFRIEYYQTAVKGIIEKPFTGFGLENYTVAFDKYYRGTLDNQDWDNQWADKAHNVFLEAGVATGLVGLLVYLGMWLTVFMALIKNIANYKLPDGRYYMSIGLFGIFSAYLVNNQLTIESTTNAVYSAVFIALAVFLSRGEVKEKQNNTVFKDEPWAGKEKMKTGILLAMLMAAVIALNAKINIPELVANYRVNQGERAFAEMDYYAGFNKFAEALAVNNPAVNSYLRYRYGRMAIMYQENALIFGVEIDRQVILKAIALQEENARKEWPVFTRNWVLAGKLANILLENSGDPAEKIWLKKQADSYFEKALALSPNHGATYLEWARTDIIIGDYLSAEQKISQAENINPKNGYLWWLRGIIAIKLKQNEIAEDCFTKAQLLGYKTLYPLSLAEAGKAYDQAGSWDKSVMVYQKMNNLYSWNINGFLKLADAYHNLGEKEKATGVLQKALPSANAYYQALIREQIIKIDRDKNE